MSSSRNAVWKKKSLRLQQKVAWEGGLLDERRPLFLLFFPFLLRREEEDIPPLEETEMAHR